MVEYDQNVQLYQNKESMMDSTHKHYGIFLVKLESKWLVIMWRRSTTI
jgi:hypothetical protein